MTHWWQQIFRQAREPMGTTVRNDGFPVVFQYGQPVPVLRRVRRPPGRNRDELATAQVHAASAAACRWPDA